ncbi:hypothetical protein DMB95_01535 [Campylobacter sp. MIT 12-8780]|uniref:hypothetical protein n=1 Tax=unclassified Campylobacter TaxID=2593542 RepID=UPI00115F4E65|nr:MULTISPECIES: hypothetical protein [unclassified Campylobacter]NDJ28132.1 hypothetical protein [Campylobacter sp. MIT 19-121]TQR42323.1 hypothetical protein DMB95_01535 [Campylobacter sp. MIT 12-8780]
MKKYTLAILAFCFSLLHALSIDEMLEQEILPPSFDCAKVVDNDDELLLCNQSALMIEYENKLSAAMDNFYSSYYRIVSKHINAQDKNKLRNISKAMIKERQRKVKEELELTDLPEGANPIIPALNAVEMMQDVYLAYFQKITNFIYDEPKYKHIFEQIFTPNAQEYYKLIQTSDTLKTIIDKAAKEGLVDKRGRLLAK